MKQAMCCTRCGDSYGGQDGCRDLDCPAESEEQDCTCYVPFAGPADIAPPEPKRDQWCPVHGRDPDAERDRRIDERNEK